MAEAPGDPDDTRHVVALWRLQSAYADVVTRRAWPELGDVIRPDAVIEIDTVTAPVRTVMGPAELAAFVGPAVERFDHFAFVILNTVVEVISRPDGPGGTGEARGRIFMCEVRHDPASDTWPNVHGLYQDRYEWHAGRWWIAGRHYRSLARQGPPTEIIGLPGDLGPLGP
jgi:hypothetical protein